MALPQIVLIDENKQRIQQFETILSFLEYDVLVAGSSNYLSLLNGSEQKSAIFIGRGCEKQGTIVNDVLDNATLAKIPVILLIEQGESANVSSVIQSRVSSSLEWPSKHLVLTALLKKWVIPKVNVSRAKKQGVYKKLVGNSQSIHAVRELVGQVASSDATVLVLGESGTGKEVVAQALHQTSKRKHKPFVPVNCGAIPAELLESELFGHEKGAFTGALTTRQGRFEMAEGGTLFLDEIGDMPMPMQVKLLRVLQERTFERVGSNKSIECDVRIIAATHRHLETEIAEKRFREDLFYRLNVFPIELPALRERVEDIPQLSADLIARMAAAKRDTVLFSGQALALMMQHPWPGNVRELSNFIERLAITHSNSIVDAADLPEKFQNYEIPDDLDVESLGVKEPVADIDDVLLAQDVESEKIISPIAPIESSHLPEQGLDLKDYLNKLEVNLIEQALKECNGVVAHAAKMLNMRRTTLVEKLRKYELS